MSSENAESAAVMSDAELAEAKRYGRLDLACSLADKAVDLTFFGVMAWWLARPLDTWLQRFPRLADIWTLRLAVFFLILLALHLAISFPLSFYSGHVLEHRFRLSTQSFSRWLWRYVKRNLLAGTFLLLLIVGLYWLIWTTGSAWWIAATLAFFLVTIVLGQLTPVLILPLFYRVERLDRPELTERLSRLAEGTGLSIEGVYRLDLSAETVKANAMLTGLGRTRRVLLGDTLLAGFTPDEVEVIFAHEIGHHVFRHLRWMIASGLAFSAAGFWLCDRLLAAWIARGGAAFDYARLPIDALPMLLLILTVFSLAIQPLQNAVSRRFERQADRYALQRTGRKDAYRSAFCKLARLNKDDPDPPRLEVFLFHSHPPIAERLAVAEEPSKEIARPNG
ncbi:MAG: M48 family metallopeptidase [Planctomycetaceae bacterium]|nr:M48 family metallopeptidase [Planctomycetaceae bacterium]